MTAAPSNPKKTLEEGRVRLNLLQFKRTERYESLDLQSLTRSKSHLHMTLALTMIAEIQRISDKYDLGCPDTSSKKNRGKTATIKGQCKY